MIFKLSFRFIAIMLVSIPSAIFSAQDNNAAETSVIKQQAQAILSSEPFPHEEIRQRWTLDIDTDFDTDSDMSIFSLSQNMIQIIAASAELILWIVLLILLIMVYLNRHLLSLKLDSFSIGKKPVKEESHRIIETSPYTDTQEVFHQLNNALVNFNPRLFCNIIYHHASNQLNMPDHKTEFDLLQHAASLKTSCRSLMVNIVNFRLITAYQHHEVEKNIMQDLFDQWCKEYMQSNE